MYQPRLNGRLADPYEEITMTTVMVFHEVDDVDSERGRSDCVDYPGSEVAPR
jgi:hypothetical protein